ncbi:MAG: hypothetical protein J6L65_03620 [Lachnospiraceae bacterium]|nr:hypothetical protein [Lachnospiraceae bacterium]
MKHSKWKMMFLLRGDLFTSIFYYFMMFMIFIALTPIVMDFAEAVEIGRNVLRVLEGKEIDIVFLLTTVVVSSCLYFTSHSGCFGDILFGRVTELPSVESSQMTRGGNIIELRNIVGYEIFVKQNDSRVKKLKLIEKVQTLPQGDSYKILYLKRSKVIVNVEVLSGSVNIEKKQVMLKEPLVTQYEEFLPEVINNHKSRLNVVLVFCIMGVVALIGWLIYTTSDFIYWYIFEKLRCILGWIAVISLNAAFLIWFLLVDRSGLLELKQKDVSVTEPISTRDLVCSRLLLGLRGKIVGVEVKVRGKDDREEKFLLYKGASPYWNCLPLKYERIYDSSLLENFIKGEQSLEAVRFHYLKKSKIIVKMDV